MSKERRIHHRYNLDLLHFWGMTGESSLNIQNVSKGGMSLLMDRSYPRGSHLAFRREDERIEAMVLESIPLNPNQIEEGGPTFQVRLRFVEEQDVERLGNLQADT